MSELVINLDNLSKIYKEDIGIKNIDLKINKQEIYGFIGPNGAGKSTTIRTILNLIKPTGGSAEVFNMDSEKDYEEILKRVGYLPSELFYYDNIKGIDLLKYSEKFYNKDCSKRRNELAELLNIDLSKKVDDLSFGNRKKIGIIDAMQHEPELLILDEPTGGLDPLIQNNFFKILEDCKERGTTIFFSSHILSEVQKVCDKVAIIKEGKIVDIQDIAEIKDDNYKSVKITTDDEFDGSLEGISKLEKMEGEIEFLYRGSMDALIKYISKYSISDIQIDDPDLEEIFIHYYE